MRIGVIADTHLPSIIRSVDELGPQLGELLEACDLILHAGDVTAPSVIDWCEQFAPTWIARGNNDLFEHSNLSDRHLFERCGWRTLRSCMSYAPSRAPCANYFAMLPMAIRLMC